MGVELITLATAAGRAVSQAAGTGVWDVFRDRVARQFGRPGRRPGDRAAALTQLDRTAGDLFDAGPGRAGAAQERAAAAWALRFLELLEETVGADRSALIAALQELVDLASHPTDDRDPAGSRSPSEEEPASDPVTTTIVTSNGTVAAHHIHVSTSTAPSRPLLVGVVPLLASAFQPRESIRHEIDRSGGQHATGTQVLSGPGGVGKSQLAAALAHQARGRDVDVVVWADATETSQIVTTFARAARQVWVPDATGEDPEHDARAFLNWLAVTDSTWLVVLDDLTDLGAAMPWWPPTRAGSGPRGRVLATTRLRDARLSGAGRTVIDVGTYTPAEAFAYLHERMSSAEATHLLDTQAADLVGALGGLPLALSRAAAFMINEDIACRDYLRHLTGRAGRLDRLLPRSADTEGYGRRITASLLLTLDAADRYGPVGLAVPALRLAAHLDPAGHPQALWATSAVTDYLTAHRTPSRPRVHRPDPVTSQDARDALRLLHRHALLTHATRDTDREVRLHVLTARAARESTAAADLPAIVRATADALLELWPDPGVRAPELTAVLRANTAALADFAGNLLLGHPILLAAHRGPRSHGPADTPPTRNLYGLFP
ncbi:NB-ARC domain-containing protein [Kitasatospora sp. NPDC048365]|uniref:NB-ARC domain-containing protein n=1 Tax=Kitasatospora sp. NPDC048365 TaxID=3364050 RepID=UPI003721C691